MLIHLALGIATAWMPVMVAFDFWRSLGEKTTGVRAICLLFTLSVDAALCIAVAHAWGWL